jgi:hypothetical protein
MNFLHLFQDYVFLSEIQGFDTAHISYLSIQVLIQWNLYSSFSSGVWKRNNVSGKTIDVGAIVEIGSAQGP